MFREFAPQLFTARHGLVLCLSLTAAAGWGSFAVSSQSSTEMKRQLRRQEISLHDTQTQLLSERTRTQVSLSETAQLRAELAAARREVNRLSQARDQVRAELPPSRPDEKGRSGRTNEARDVVSGTGSIGPKTTRPPQVKAASSEASPTQARKKQLAAAEITAPWTQKATEKPQRGKVLTVISALDTVRLRQLTESVEAQAR